MNKFRKLGFIRYNGEIEVHSSLLSVVLADQPAVAKTEPKSSKQAGIDLYLQQPPHPARVSRQCQYVSASRAATRAGARGGMRRNAGRVMSCGANDTEKAESARD